MVPSKLTWDVELGNTWYRAREDATKKATYFIT